MTRMIVRDGFTEMISFGWSRKSIEMRRTDPRLLGGSFKRPELTKAWNRRKKRSKKPGQAYAR